MDQQYGTAYNVFFQQRTPFSVFIFIEETAESAWLFFYSRQQKAGG